MEKEMIILGDDGEIISRDIIEKSIESGEAYRIMHGSEKVGGLVIKTDGAKGELLLLFVSPAMHSKGFGYSAWKLVESMHPEVKLWETCTPYFETRNIHFYVNRCGFHIVEFFNRCHPDPKEEDGTDEFFRFEKRIE